MPFFRGHPLWRTTAQHIWKVIGAFSLGIVAVAGSALLLSDVHRIPQGTRAQGAAKSNVYQESNLAAATPSGEGQQIRADQNFSAANASERGEDPAVPLKDAYPPSTTVVQVMRGKSVTGSQAFGDPRSTLERAEGETTASLNSASQQASAQIRGQKEIRGTPSSLASPVPARSVSTVAPETPLSIRLTQQVSSKENHTGETFKGTLAGPLKANGVVVAETGAAVLGRVVDARNAKLFRRHSNLNLELTDITTVNGTLVKVRTTQWYETGSHSKVVKTAMLPAEAAKKAVSGVIGEMKVEGNAFSDSAEENATGFTNGHEKGGKKEPAVTLPAGSRIDFRLLEPLTVEVKSQSGSGLENVVGLR